MEYVKIVVRYEIQYMKLLLGVRYISVDYVKIVVRYKIHQCGVCEIVVRCEIHQCGVCENCC